MLSRPTCWQIDKYHTIRFCWDIPNHLSLLCIQSLLKHCHVVGHIRNLFALVFKPLYGVRTTTCLKGAYCVPSTAHVLLDFMWPRRWRVACACGCRTYYEGFVASITMSCTVIHMRRRTVTLLVNFLLHSCVREAIQSVPAISVWPTRTITIPQWAYNHSLSEAVGFCLVIK